MEVAPAPSLDEGARLGKYTIVRHLATGGMAELFLARAGGLPGFEREVVIKRILPQLAAQSDFVQMFLDEARIVATLQHPNLVQVYDVGVIDGTYFMAMEYLHGRDLRSLQRTLPRGHRALPLEQALQIGIGVAAGLHYAHEKKGFDGQPLSIIHRDVSPQNVIVTFAGDVKLLDFGIATASIRVGETRCGTIKGKISYMSPEQARGESIDRRSDLFALGIILWELTLGRRLFPGSSDFDVMKQIVEGRIPPPRELEPDYPQPLERIVLRALARDRTERYSSGRELQADLEALLRSSHLYASPSTLQRYLESVCSPPPGSTESPPKDPDRLPTVSVIARLVSASRARRRPHLLLVAGVLAVAAAAALAAWKLRPVHRAEAPLIAASPARVPRPSPPPAPVPDPAPPTPAPIASPPPSPPLFSPAPVPEPKPTERPRPTRRPLVFRRPPEPTGDATLVLAATPWCQVSVDGTAKGPTPLSLRLPPGRHTIFLTNPEFSITRSLPVSLRPGEIQRKKLVFPH